MSEMLKRRELVADNPPFLAYVKHMAQTAQPSAARRLFELFAQQETRAVEAFRNKDRED